jgi:hypothetical protein
MIFMATLYTAVNQAFLSKITDSWLGGLKDAELGEQCTVYRNTAVAKFSKCRKDLTLQNATGFIEDLSGEEIEILASFMVLEWLTPQVYSVELIRQALGNREFQLSSQANHLKELKSLRKDTQIEVSKLLVDYTYNNHSQS